MSGSLARLAEAAHRPLPVIVIFAGISDGAVATALWAVDPSLHERIIWFMIGMPVLVMIAFFLTLNFNHRVLYAPVDFRTDEAFDGISRIYQNQISGEHLGAFNLNTGPRVEEQNEQKH